MNRFLTNPTFDAAALPFYFPRVFELVSNYQPAGDQPQAIEKLTDGILSGAKHQMLLAALK